jgi:hypothetical protein
LAEPHPAYFLIDERLRLGRWTGLEVRSPFLLAGELMLLAVLLVLEFRCDALLPMGVLVLVGAYRRLLADCLRMERRLGDVEGPLVRCEAGPTRPVMAPRGMAVGARLTSSSHSSILPMPVVWVEDVLLLVPLRSRLLVRKGSDVERLGICGGLAI